MERKPPALAADDHPPSPPPPPTPAPPSEPRTPAGHPTSPPPPPPPPRSVRRSARIRGDSDPPDARHGPEPAQRKRVSTDDVTGDPENHAADVDHDARPEEVTAAPASPPAAPEGDKSRQPPEHDADSDAPADHLPTPQRSEPDLKGGDPSKSQPQPGPDAEEAPEADAANADAADADAADVDAETQDPDMDDVAKEPGDMDIAPKSTADARVTGDDDTDNPQAPEASGATEDTSAAEAASKEKLDATGDAMNDDDGHPQSASGVPQGDEEPTTELKDANAEINAESPEPTTTVGEGPKQISEKPASPTAEKRIDPEDAMDVDQPEEPSADAQGREASAMEVERPDKAPGETENPLESLETVNQTKGGKKKSAGDTPPAVTDSDDEIRKNGDEVSKPRSPIHFSPPRTRRQLAIRTPSSPESPPARSGAPSRTPKSAPQKSSRRSESSDDIVAIEKPGYSRYETRSSRRGASPVRTRLRRHSEPVPTYAPPAKPRSRRSKKYSRKPVKDDRLRVLWHIDNIYYEGVVDSVLAFRGKRFYDITYDSGEREYYLELTHRKWRFADGQDGDEQDEEDEEEHSPQRDIDYSKYPQIGDRILVMWHVDGKYYPGKVNDILKANGAWFYDVDYEGGDREFFLDLTIRKWKYPESGEEAAKHPLVDRKIPKPSPKPKPKSKLKAKPKPKRVARKTVGPGSSSFAAGDSPSQGPPRPSRRQRTLEMLLDDQAGGPEHDLPQEDTGGGQARASGRDQVVDVLDGTGSRGKEPMVSDEPRSPQIPKDLALAEADGVDASFDVAFHSFGGDDIDVLDEMEPPLPSQTVLKRPRASDDSPKPAPEIPKESNDVSDIFSDLLRKSPLRMPEIPDSLTEPLPPPSPPMPQLTPEKKSESLSRRDRPPSPPASQRASKSPSPPAEPSSRKPVRSILKRKLAEQPFSVPMPKRQTPTPRSEPRPKPLRQQRRLRTIEPNAGDGEGHKEAGKTGDDPNVADIVSVAGIVAKKWAREEVGRISDGINKLKRQISSLKTLHSKSLSSNRQKQRTADTHAEILPDEEAERQINNLGTNVVALVRKYRDTVEEREKKLKIQFTRMRTKFTEQNEGLMETAEVLSELDIVGLEALKGLQPKTRKKLEIPPPLPPRQVSQAYTQPPTYALSSGVPVQQYQGSQNAPGTLGQHNDAIVRNLRRRLADLVTRSEWLGDEVKRLQGREKILFREKSTALAELRKARRSPALVDLTANGKGKGVRAPSRTSLPTTKQGPTKPVGITKRRTRGSAGAPTPSTPTSKGSGKALRKTLPRSNSKYKAPPLVPQQAAPQAKLDPNDKAPARIIPTRSPTASAPIPPPPSGEPMTQTRGVPLATSVQATAADAGKTRKVPSALQNQMDHQASDLISLTFTVWLLQDESRSEPPNGPGERMDTWVRGCVKKCLNSALAFLTACGGIFRAKSNLKADVDNESIYTHWIMAAPTDDAAIERARGNYSLWDPSLRDSEWQAEKRVLRGLTICHQKALALTPAGKFTATLMYAKAILNRAITDFEKFMPATITVLPSKRVTPTSTGPSIPVTRTAKTAVPIQPRVTVAPATGPSNGQVATPLERPKDKEATQDKDKLAGDSGTASDGKPTASGGTASDRVASPKTDQDVQGSTRNIMTSSAPNASGPSPVPAANSSRPVPSPATPQVPCAAPETSTGQANNISQEGGEGGQATPPSQSGPHAAGSVGAKPQESLQPKAQTPGSTVAAPVPKSDSTTQQSQAIGKIQQPSQKASASGTQQKSASGQGLGTSASRRDSAAGEALTSQDQGETPMPTKEMQSSERSPTTAAGVALAGQTPSVPGSAASALKDGTDASQRIPRQPSSGANQEKSLSQGGDTDVGSAKPTESTPQRVRKGAKVSKSKLPPGPVASKRSTTPADVLPPASQSTSASIPSVAAGGPTQPSKMTTKTAALQKRSAGITPTAAQSASRNLRNPSRLQSRGQTRSQKKGSSSGQSKGTRTQESRKQVRQPESGKPMTQAPAVSTGAHATVTVPATRLQEIPRKHMTLGAPRAPLELASANIVSGQAVNAGASGTSGPLGSPTQRTYPMLSRNQVRVSSSAIPAGALLSRNQITAGKRPTPATAQMSVPAAPQRRVAPGLQTSGLYVPSDGADHMEVDAGRDLHRLRGDLGPTGAEQHEAEAGRGSGTAAANDLSSPTHPPATGFPDESDNATAMYSSSPPLNVMGRHQNPGNAFQTTGSKKIGFKSLPLVPPRQPSHSGGTGGGGGTLPNIGLHDRAVQNSLETQRTSSAPMAYARTSQAQTSEYPYGQGGEPVYSPYNAAGQDRDLPVDLMNPPTPSSFAGLDGYGISLNADQVHLQRDSLPATPSDFDRYGVQSPINLERQSSWGTHQQQSQGQLGHIMNPQRRDSGYNQPQTQSQPQRYQTRSTFHSRR